MHWVLLIIIGIVLCFGFVVFFGAPYVPTLSQQANIALDMIDLKPNQTLLELGSGDGKILLAAAERGWNAVGIELNPILVGIAWLRTRRYRKQVRIIWGNFWQVKKWPKADGVFVFLLPKYMQKLDATIMQWHQQPITLVSFAFTIPNKKPIRQDKRGVYVYQYTHTHLKHE